MLPSPAVAVVTPTGATLRSPASMALADAGVAGLWRGGPAAGGAAPGSTGRPTIVAAALAAGGCCAWPLPVDTTCAVVARGVYREMAAALTLPEELASDGLLMTSELAANTLHAQANIEFDGAGAWPIAGAPELWIYLRRAAAGGNWSSRSSTHSVAGRTTWRRCPAPPGPMR